jgi:AraC-like DNA-binding protein
VVSELKPVVNQAYIIENNTMLHILKGCGSIDVDFKRYHNWQDKLIFLDKGQYVKYQSDQFEVRKIEFDNSHLFKNRDARVLFKHLVSLGYIDYKECKNNVEQSVFSKKMADIMDTCTMRWYLQNPFRAKKNEYQVIFDVKEIVDQEYINHLSNEKINSKLGVKKSYQAQALIKEKIGITIKTMLRQKRILECKKKIAFTTKSIKEIAYECGFKDPAYFNRVFNRMQGVSPNQFREAFDFENKDTFLQELYAQINAHHKNERSINFYANKLNLPIKTLSKKVKDKLNLTLGQLIRREIISTAKTLLDTDVPTKLIALELGFIEANHFSAFFKHHTGKSPTEFRKAKANTLVE